MNGDGSDSHNSYDRECPDESGLVDFANEEARLMQMVPKTPFIDAKKNNLEQKKGQTQLKPEALHKI